MHVLDSELERARCVVMLWSDHATQSDWVRKEGMSALNRDVLVPIRITKAEPPREFETIQFADLNLWDGNEAAPAFTDLLLSIRHQMLPQCRIRFESLFRPQWEDLKDLYSAYLKIADRLGFMPLPNQFRPPSSADERRRLHRTVASLQVSIEWDPLLTDWLRKSPAHENLLNEVTRIERHVPLIWLRMLDYSGPFFSSVASPHSHANFLGFASLRFFHQMYNSIRFKGQTVKIPPPLTDAQLSFPRWEGAISAFFDDADDIAAAYVTHLDDVPLGVEEIFYGPKSHLQRAYGMSLRKFPYTDPLWLERYVIPERELRFALEDPTQGERYLGNARIRKVVNLNNKDLPALYDL